MVVRVPYNLDEIENELARRRLVLEEQDPVSWASRHYYIEDTEAPIVLQPHQAAILRYAFRKQPNGAFPYSTVIYSCPKKGGKTAIAGLVTRWSVETWGKYAEVYCVGNDAEQARERAFAAVKRSIELTPGYDRKHASLVGRWTLLEAEARCAATGGTIKAVATDFKGEAGSNPSLTVWTELWGYTSEAAKKFWAEMAPSPTRHNSIRWVETYAGYEGESDLLWSLYEASVINGRQLTAGELNAPGAFAEAPNASDRVPVWVNEQAGILAYWDSGPVARRMPWQQGARAARYYAGEAGTQTPQQFTRLHDNQWVSAVGAFVPLEWWDACRNPLPLVPGERTPLVMSADAGVTGDCFAVGVISRDPARPKDSVALRLARKWEPPAGGAGIDFAGPESFIKEICRDYNVVELAYDPYQLHDMATRLMKDSTVWCRPFGQGPERLQADKGLYDLIKARRVRHNGEADVREHIGNANAKSGVDEESKLRLVKKSGSRKIDLAVMLSMGAHECLRLNLE